MSDYIVKKDDVELLIEEKQNQIRTDLITQYIKARKEKHMTQEDLANELGVKRPNISRFENGTYNPTLDMLVKVAECMNMDLRIELVKRKESGKDEKDCKKRSGNYTKKYRNTKINNEYKSRIK